jgi:endonuclease V-like protein UPF0215 family
MDDSPFHRLRRGDCFLLFTLMRMDFTVEGFDRRAIEVDGTDSTSAVEEILINGIGKNADLLMANGITFCGFNLCDFNAISNRVGIPVITVTRKDPDIDSMRRAIERHHPEKEFALEILSRSSPSKIELPEGKTLFANVFGIGLKEAGSLISRAIKTGLLPEPIRLSHLVGTGMFKDR